MVCRYYYECLQNQTKLSRYSKCLFEKIKLNSTTYQHSQQFKLHQYAAIFKWLWINTLTLEIVACTRSLLCCCCQEEAPIVIILNQLAGNMGPNLWVQATCPCTLQKSACLVLLSLLDIKFHTTVKTIRYALSLQIKFIWRNIYHTHLHVW